LAKIEGVTDIETDSSNRVCSFKVPKSNTDYAAQLAKFAETNSHLAGYTIKQPASDSPVSSDPAASEPGA
jgi:hypothetical protein